MGENTNLVVAKNGAKRDVITGRIVESPIQSSKQGQAMARTRWDKAAAASRQALRDAVSANGTVAADPRRTSVQSWGIIVGRAAEVLLNTDNARGFADLARFVGHATGYLPTTRDEAQPPPVAPVQVGRILLLAAELLAAPATNGDNERVTGE